MDGRIEVHAKIHDEGEELRHRRQNAPAAGGADRKPAAVGSLRDDSNGLLVRFTPESLTATLDGRHPVAMLPVRIETRFDSETHLRVRVFPDQVHIDAHDPALKADG